MLTTRSAEIAHPARGGAFCQVDQSFGYLGGRDRLGDHPRNCNERPKGDRAVDLSCELVELSGPEEGPWHLGLRY
jgi:hypothetical protein